MFAVGTGVSLERALEELPKDGLLLSLHCSAAEFGTLAASLSDAIKNNVLH